MSAPPTLQKSPGPWKLLWQKLRRNRVAMTGLWILVLLYTASCFAGFLAPYPFDDARTDTAKAGPMLFGGYVHEAVEIPSEIEEGTVTEYRRRWSWFQGGVHFHDSAGNFTLRPHVHPITEKPYTDAWGDTSYSRAAADRSVSLPIEFFVESEDEHEVFSLMGLFPVKGTTRLFGVRAPEGTPGVGRIYLLGSDETGRDIFSRLLFGGQISLSVGILGIFISMSIGLVVGGIAGYFGGIIDFVAMRIVEVILSIPGLYLLIVLGSLIRSFRDGDGKPLSSTKIYLSIVLAMATIGWASNSRVIRGMVLALKENDYVMAARAGGVGHFTIIVRHILPNTFSFVIVTATLYVPYYILSEVSLSFLGLGIQEPEASWGNMLREAQQVATLTQSPWIVAPGVLIFVTVLAYNFLGDGLRDAADPKAVIVRKRKSLQDDDQNEEDPAPST